METVATERILLVDDHPIVRDGLRRLIEIGSDMEICGETGNGDEVMKLILEHEPTMIVLDLTIEGADGLSLIENISTRFPKVQILILSMHNETTHALRCIKAGARGYLMKKSASRDIVSALQTVASGEVYMSDAAKALVLDACTKTPHITENQSRIHSLSPREFQVFRLYGEGYSTSQIGAKLQCSTKTVETHCRRIRGKLGLHSLSQLIAQAGAHIGSCPV